MGPAPIPGNIVSGNRVFDNAANGIRIASSSNQILGNVTGRNGRLATARRPAFDLHDVSPGSTCDANRWSGNAHGTAFPPCTAGP